jgi:hypothetical protein
MSTTYANGKYEAEILDQGFEESSTKHTPYFFLQLRILGRYDAQDKLQECLNYERTYQQYLANDTGVDILKSDLKALGVEVTDLTQLDPGCPKFINLVGRKIDVVCKLETYQGAQRERWSIYRSRKKLNLDSVRALNDRFGHLLRDGNGQAKPAPGVAAPNKADAPF